MEKLKVESNKQRVIRVFVSSTFCDMQAEREELIKHIFPQLRKLCEKREVTWGHVDLRWGITDEQKADGNVLPICLAEIEKCRPYFIGILGERYGCVRNTISRDLIQMKPWIKECQSQSVTELEILHGVLNDPKMADHTFFYFRDPKYIEHLPVDAKKEDFLSENAESEKKLLDLKNRICASGLPVHENFLNSKTLGEAVLNDLKNVIDRLFPENSQMDILDQEALDNEIFAKSRTRIYIGNQENFCKLDRHAQGDGQPLVILGESGSGKSALLANWALKYKSEHPNELVIMHFIGASASSTDWPAMLRRIMGEFKRRFTFNADIPENPDELRSAFPNWLHMAAAKNKVILIVDALNQLEDRGGAQDLLWLPESIPVPIRVFLSTLPGHAFDELKQRAWPTLQVESLKAHERHDLIVNYLKQYSKELNSDRMDRITALPQTANPLYLRTMLEELCLWGDHNTLDWCISHYLEAPTVDKLFTKILLRYEQDYEQERPGLVREAMSLIWASRKGLSEAELLDLLGTPGDSLPNAYLSPLFLAAEASLITHSGLIDFSHDHIRQAVQNTYLPSEATRRAVHLRLANYFTAQELSPRKINELPWQFAQAEEWLQLYRQLSNTSFFCAAYPTNEFDLKSYWNKIESQSELRMLDAYADVIHDQHGSTDAHWSIGRLLGDMGYIKEAYVIRARLAEHALATGNIANYCTAIVGQALLLTAQGEPDAALMLYKDAERRYRQLDDLHGLAVSLANQASILSICGDSSGALSLLKESESILRQLNDLQELQICIGNQAVIFRDLGKIDKSMALLREQERICQQIGNVDSLQRCRGNQGVILQVRGDFVGALKLYIDQEKLCRQLGNLKELQISLNNQARILMTRGDLRRAMILHEEVEKICRQLGNLDGLQESLGSQVGALRQLGELDKATDLIKEQESICRQIKKPDGLQACLGNHASILFTQGEIDGAMKLCKEQEAICRQLANPSSIQACLGNQAAFLCASGDFESAMPLLKEQESICRDLSDINSLSANIGNQALVLKSRGNLDGAMDLLIEQERICQRTGNLNGLQSSLCNQSSILCARGNLKEAIVLLKKQENICRKIPSPYFLTISLLNQAVIQIKQAHRSKALSLLKEARGMAQRHGFHAQEKQIGFMQECLGAKP